VFGYVVGSRPSTDRRASGTGRAVVEVADSLAPSFRADRAVTA
jgi:hypothetical protein